MQTKISAFFNRQPPPKIHNQSQLPYQTLDDPSTAVKRSDGSSAQEPQSLSNGYSSQNIEEESKKCDSICSQKLTTISNKNLNKKRSYAQLYLELGQSDFLLRSCSTCGFRYACGDEGDEKVHKEFHKEYTHGIQFKGWHNERVVDSPSTMTGRIILLLDDDPPVHKKKVQKVVEMMEMDLGSGWLIHLLCKVYLYIFHQRVAGCLVAEPIKTAYRVLLNSGSPKSFNSTNENKNGTNSSILRFGDITFQREAVKRNPSAIEPEALQEDLAGAILLENEAMPAVCGIRAIWVAPSLRRKQIASHLLDAVRMSFCKGLVLESSQLAFSNPTSSGRALACRYLGTTSFLAYKAY